MVQPRSVVTSDDSSFESRVVSVGSELALRISGVLDAIPNGPLGPAELARAIGVDKVLASRAIKAARQKDPLVVLYHSPGPEPLRRLLRAARKGAVAPELITAAEEAVRGFENLIRQQAGDRSALDAIISAWLPEARSEFELRRKQAAYRAMSQLLGASVDTALSTLILRPADDGVNIDIACVLGFYGLQRLRPGSRVRCSTRRVVARDSRPRCPRTLGGEPAHDFAPLRLDAFCSTPPPELAVEPVERVVHYTLGHDAFGPQSAADLVFGELNVAETPLVRDRGSDFKRMLTCETTVPAKLQVFDVLLHDAVFPGGDPELFLYDTAYEGMADVNDRTRDIDRLDLGESIQSLGKGLPRFRTVDVPRYPELLRHAFDRLGWDSDAYRGYRCRIEYPVYGTQVTLAFTVAA